MLLTSLRSVAFLGSVVSAFRTLPTSPLVTRRLTAPGIMASFSASSASPTDAPPPPPPLTRIAWLRSELRVRDNGVLEAAAADGARVLPVFVFDPSEFGPDARGKITGARKVRGAAALVPRCTVFETHTHARAARSPERARRGAL